MQKDTSEGPKTWVKQNRILSHTTQLEGEATGCPNTEVPV